MVDPERLRRTLQRVADDLAVLRRYAEGDRGEVLSDAARLGHVKYLFVTCIEGCIDAAQHVCASEGWGPPDTNADAMAVLARHGALDADLATSMADAVRFRNLLVHRYASIDDERVVAHLDEVTDLDTYVAELAKLLTA